jgi:hypothetical protein
VSAVREDGTPAPSGPAAIEIELVPEATPDRVLVAKLRLHGATATSVRAFALEARAADITIAASRDDGGIVPATIEAAGARAIVRLGRAPVPPFEIALRIRAEAPAAATRPTLAVDENGARVPGEVIPLPEPLPAGAVDVALTLGKRDAEHALSAGSTLAADPVFRGTTTLGALRGGYAVMVDGDLGTAKFHTTEGDDFASWSGYTAFDPRWAFAETAGVRAGMDRYLGVRPAGRHAIVMVSDRRRELPFAMVPRAGGLWISADIEAPWDATPLLRVSQHFAQRMIGGALWMGMRGGPREPSGWFWSEGVSRVAGRETLYTLGLLSFDDLAADLNAALAEATLSKLRTANLDALVTAANAGEESALDARRMLAARGILWASGVDARARDASKGQKDLRDTLRDILTEAATSRRDTWSVEELAAFVEAKWGAPERAAFDRAIMKGGPPEQDVPPVAAGTCHELLRRKLSRFELGFTWTPPPKPTDPNAPPVTSLGTVSTVTTGSAAERAGVRVGDVITSMKHTPGRGDVLATLELAREGKTLKVSYAPHGEEREGPMFVRKKGAKDESCVR